MSYFVFFFFFFNDTATTEIYTLSLHDALPISPPRPQLGAKFAWPGGAVPGARRAARPWWGRALPARPGRRAPPPARPWSWPGRGSPRNPGEHVKQPLRVRGGERARGGGGVGGEPGERGGGG